MLKTAGRLILTAAAFVTALFVWLMMPELPKAFGLTALTRRPYPDLIGLVSYVLVTLFLVYLLQVKLDRSDLRDLGLATNAPRALQEGGTGWIIGAVAMVLIILGQLQMGAIRLETTIWSGPVAAAPAWAVAAAGLCRFAAVGFAEEVFFRGYVLRMVWRRHGLPTAATAASLLFGLAHFVNPGYNLLAFLNVLLISVLFTLVVLYYRNLWYAIGFHWAWDFVQSSVLNVPADGTGRFVGLWTFQPAPGAPALLLGGTYWPEGSILVTAFVAALTVYFSLGLRRQILRRRLNPSAAGPELRVKS